jgi:AcrR family transcriptional regulator
VGISSSSWEVPPGAGPILAEGHAWTRATIGGVGPVVGGTYPRERHGHELVATVEVDEAGRPASYGPRMAGVRQAMAEETRKRVVAAARGLFAENGYFATGTTEIVSAAGVGTRGALYHHFPTKEALFLEVLEAVDLDLAARVETTVTGGTWHARLRRALAAYLDASLEPEVRQIVLIDGPAVLGWERWRNVQAGHGLGAIKLVLDEGNAEGSLSVAHTESMAHLLLSVVDEAALFIAHSSDPDHARASVGASVATLVSGLAAS